ncbi:hypothetical protein V4D30_01185 [Thermodesulfovibrio sp. 3907-1M]|uniref:Uncharacterized protein n=1 Tax=Thermodesulfovibrio autotrophicus TaxID=3118333 RepID=A0AAU8GXW6_9BACT
MQDSCLWELYFHATTKISEVEFTTTDIEKTIQDFPKLIKQYKKELLQNAEKGLLALYAVTNFETLNKKKTAEKYELIYEDENENAEYQIHVEMAAYNTISK